VGGWAGNGTAKQTTAESSPTGPQPATKGYCSFLEPRERDAGAAGAEGAIRAAGGGSTVPPPAGSLVSSLTKQNSKYHRLVANALIQKFRWPRIFGERREPMRGE
jgi:hypothetical protein